MGASDDAGGAPGGPGSGADDGGSAPGPETSTGPRRLRHAVRLARWLLLFYPEEFRRDQAEPLLNTLEELWRTAWRRSGLPGLLRRAVPDLLDLAGGGVEERFVRFREQTGSSSGRPPRKERPMGDVLGDLRTALRTLRRRPTFALVAMLTLGLAMGANTLIFGLMKGVLLEPLPYQDPDRLVVLWSHHEVRGRDAVSLPDLLDWRRESELLESIAGYQYWGLTFTGGDEPLDVPSMKVTTNLFATLGVEAALGRTFVSEESEPGRGRVAVVSHGFWTRRFGSDPGVVGSTVELDFEPHTIVGVMPEGFEFPPDGDTDIWVPVVLGADAPHEGRGIRMYLALGRVALGATVPAVRDELQGVAARLADRHPETNRGIGADAVPALEQLVGDVRPAILMLSGAVAFLLLIACANVANLALARVASRRQEIAVRAALGAGRLRILRQQLVDSLVVAAGGGVLGVLLALAGTTWIRALPGDVIPRLGAVEVDPGVLLFTLAITLAVGIGFGIVPALAASRTRISPWLEESSRTAVGGRERRMLDGLVVVEVALAVVLLVGAGLLARSFARLTAVDPGFDPQGVLTANVFLSESRYEDPAAERRYFREALRRIRALPGITSAGAVTAVPMDEVGIDFDLPFRVEGRPAPEEGDEPQAQFRVATPGYFETLRIELVRGRLFGEADREGAPGVMVVNETMARRHFPDGDPVGERIVDLRGGPHEIVGVVRDLRHYGLDSEPRPVMYVPFAQNPFSGMVLVVRTPGDPVGLIGAVERELYAVDPEQPVYAFNTMEGLVADSMLLPRLSALLVGVFAGAALVLAIVGIYGVMSYSVSRRTREIGLRMALGARIGHTLRLVVGRAMAMVALGVALGVAGSLAVSRVLEGLLYGVDSRDPVVLIAASLVFLAVGLAASWLPARRAARVDPLLALRSDAS